MMSLGFADLLELGPFLHLALGGVAVVLLDTILGRRRTIPWSLPTLAVLSLTFADIVARFGDGGGPAGGPLSWYATSDRFSLFLAALVCLSAACCVLLSEPYLERMGRRRGEYHALILFSAAGMVLFSSTTDLIALFIGLELLSIPVYILSGYLRGDLRSAEAAMKYFLLGAFSSAVFLLGLAFVYGASGTTDLRAAMLAGASTPALLKAGFVLLLTGFLFKIGAVPFHMWIPDVYEGAPTTVTAFMATAVKTAAIGALLRVLALRGGSPGGIDVAGMLWWIAVLTMTVGNLAALTQSSMKRMLAYSSIAHAGYLLVGATVFAGSGDPRALNGILYYLLAYTFMTIGAFAVVIAMGEKGRERLEMDDYGGLGWRHPALGIAMSVFMISLSGIPPTAGFLGKYAVFKNAVENGQTPLVVIAVLNSAASVYYYLKVMVMLYMRPETARAAIPRSLLAGAVVAVCVFIVLWAGLAPDSLLPGVPTLLSWAGGSLLAAR
ncbi:MAG: NADH-quinone oxidoreductase subunit N [Candidatus Eisenbacteria bacterium]|nr:NADH-quinone oxidoreductase subunit N [Candidatus Eisenbacteria bacterium]